MIATCLYLYVQACINLLYRHRLRLHTSSHHSSSGTTTILSSPRKFENFIRPLHYSGYSPLYALIDRPKNFFDRYPPPPSSSPRLSGFRFPSIYAEAHALSRRIVVVYILYRYNIYNIYLMFFISLPLTCVLHPFLARLILNSRKQNRSMVPKRSCHRHFFFQSIKRKQREYFFLS